MSDDLIVNLYKEKYIQTLWNAEKPVNKKKGWRLKNKSWSLWFFNMRPVGSSPELYNAICREMADLTSKYNIDSLIGVEMAGVPIVGGTSVASFLLYGKPQRIGYTRPLPKKVRTPYEALTLLKELSQVEDYGQKQFVEARLFNNDRLGIFDDMSTDLGSKIIARLIVLWFAEQTSIEEQRPINVTCDEIFYFLNRNRGNKQKGLDFANEPELGLHPAPLNVHYVIEFDEDLPKLKNVMKPEEYEALFAYQQDDTQFQDEKVREEVLALANR